jgi:serine/threonine protein kinase
MALKAGTRLGAYEIVGAIGAGGMGEVYRARDTKLNREVAIKVLPASLAKDAAAQARFEREAQAVAALSHPNILAIHDFGMADGVPYAATELLEGETLRARLAGGALPPRRAIEFGVQIVRGIAAAHSRGIVHRDLKPENVFLTRDGVVKILDFGLAKTTELPQTLAGGVGETKIAADTTPGTVMGTVGYMSPEQVRGQPLDHRTDIFSFGAILYEMLSGRKPFSGTSHVETMNAILKEDPPEITIGANLPASLDRVVRRCLEKEPDERFYSAHDLAIALEALSGSSSQASGSIATTAVSSAPRRRGVSFLAAGVLIVLIGAAAFAAGRALSGRAPEAVTEFVRLTYRRGPISSAAIAPDGNTFVYSAEWEGSPLQLYSTRSESPESMPLPYKADVVAISSKGELALVSNRRVIAGWARPGTLSRAPLTGGASRDVLEDVQHAAWLPDGSDLAVSHVVNGKYRLEFPIGKVVYETTGFITQLAVSRDGTRVAFLDQSLMGDDRGSVSVVDASGKKQALPVECESAQGIGWSPGDKEVWFTCASKGLWRSLQAATPDGNHVRTLLRVPGSMILGDVTAGGQVLLTHENSRRGIVVQMSADKEPRDLSWLDWTQPRDLSEDGRTILFTEEGEGGGPGYGVFLRKTDGSPAVRLGMGEALSLSPDGKWAIVQKLNPAPIQLLLMPTGAGQSRPLTSDDIAHTGARFLSDGKRFVFIGFKPNRPPRVWVQAIDGGTPTPVTPEGVTGLPTPDGTKILARDRSNNRAFYPIDPNAGPPQPVTTLDPADGVVRFTADGKSVLVRRPAAGGGVQIFRLDLASGARTPVRTILPMSGTGDVGQLLLTADGSGYVYGYGATHSDLFLVKGLK